MDEYDFHTARHKANHNAWGSSKHPMRWSCWRLPMTISKNRRRCYIRVADHDLLESLRLETTISTAETRLVASKRGTLTSGAVPSRRQSPPYVNQRTRSWVGDDSVKQKSFSKRHALGGTGSRT
jgi:hypothetical protein